jgi:hypothetical protein
MLSKSHLKVLKFLPKWKKPPAWCVFYDAYHHIEFGLDFQAVYMCQKNGFRSQRFIDMNNKTPLCDTWDSDESDGDLN